MDYKLLQDTVIKRLTTPNNPEMKATIGDDMYKQMVAMTVRTVVATLEEYDRMKQNISAK